jgi:hypothetical protein
VPVASLEHGIEAHGRATRAGGTLVQAHTGARLAQDA